MVVDAVRARAAPHPTAILEFRGCRVERMLARTAREISLFRKETVVLACFWRLGAGLAQTLKFLLRQLLLPLAVRLVKGEGRLRHLGRRPPSGRRRCGRPRRPPDGTPDRM